ncbi:alpha/beta hydrolase [Bythopirellula polymerisocia]|uniref:Alpha/beta hydrolase family protein n=1 Tax=Bythopirellula polymerisocia TaxID=2528003 RepID=A0A5C6CVC8_9BACT|nr:alpha/beta hydrolase [Bythopirellula polymerisocia]TWU27467.1 hypothetical protein Pla144_22410 [Bythopirellula polymerisocia]
MLTLKNAECPETEELAILVHGTFSGNSSSTGGQWWQAGSQSANELQSRLPDGVRVATDSEVFHWTGENGERARSKAAAQLLRHLQPLEKANKSYHLVGHSHGGSVIWNALRLATLTGRPLRNLRSWTTVGTPFLHQKGRSPWHLTNLMGAILGLLLMRPVFNAGHRLATLIWDAYSGEDAVLSLLPDEEVGYLAVLRAPFISFGEWLGLSVQRNAKGIHLGTFDPSGDLTLFEYLYSTREGIILVALTGFCFYLCLHFAMMCFRPALESLRIRADTRLERNAFSRYGARWLGLWSPDDEAINGLRATLDLTCTFVKQLTPRERVYFTDNISILSRPYYWLLAPLFNWVFRPAIDSLVKGLVIRSAQGNDRPSAHVVAVLPSPVMNETIPALPEHLSKKMLNEADQHAGQVVPKFRQLLGCPSFTSGLESFSEQLSGKELVHTSYFDHSEVLDLIAMNIVSSTIENNERSTANSENCLLSSWFLDFKARLIGRAPQSLLGEVDVPRRAGIASPKNNAA